MKEWFVEVLDKKNNWVKWDHDVFDSFSEAALHAHDHGLRDETHYFRINCQWNDRFTYYGPCH